MPIDTFVDIHPERLRTPAEVDQVISSLKRYERETKQKGCVVLKQNRQLGGSYRIVSEKEAIEGINHPRTCEWYVKSYPRSYFEELRKKLNDGQRNNTPYTH